MKSIFAFSLILIGFLMTAKAATAPIKTNTPSVKVPPDKLAPVKFVPLKLGSYEFLQGNKAFADSVVSYKTGSPEPQKKYQDPKKALGLPDYKKVGYDSFVSLGCRGSLVVKFTDNSLIDGEGKDLLVYEVGPSMEPTKVEISQNGSKWITVGLLKGRTKAIDLQGKVNKGEQFYYVKLTDNKKGKCKKLKSGISVDPYDLTAGADIDAIASLNSALENGVTTPVIQPVISPIPPKQPPVNPSQPIKTLQYTINKAEQGTKLYAEFQITISSNKAQFRAGFSSKAQLIYWGDRDIPPATLKVTRKNKYHLVAQLPIGRVSQSFTSKNGSYKIALVDVSSGEFISNTIDVIRHFRTEGTPGNGDWDGDGHDNIADGGDDCDDGDPNRYPGNTEIGDLEGHDEDCDRTTFGLRDKDGDGYTDARVCNFDMDGAYYCGQDCNDQVTNIHPKASEVCDRVDNNCDGLIDEGMTNTYYFDADGDSFGNNEITVQACRLQDITKPGPWTSRPNDCDDNNNGKNPAIGCD